MPFNRTQALPSRPPLTLVFDDFTGGNGPFQKANFWWFFRHGKRDPSVPLDSNRYDNKISIDNFYCPPSRPLSLLLQLLFLLLFVLVIVIIKKIVTQKTVIKKRPS
jgi:hypothetical protein